MSEFPSVFFYFQLTLRGISTNEKIVFKELSGISMEMETNEFSENSFKHRFPTSVKFSNLVLKRGMASKDSEIVTWCLKAFNATLEEAIEPKNIIVNLLDEAEHTLKTWSFMNAWPIKWEISDLNSDNKIMIESLEFAYSSFQ